MEKTFFSTSDLAKWLGVFHTTIRRWIENGSIRGTRVGRNYKIHVEEVIRVLDHHGLPLPNVLEGYRLQFNKEGSKSPFVENPKGSILHKLLIVENIEGPAMICRRDAILGANRAFADLVGISPTDLIGLKMAEVIDESEGLLDFAQRHLGQSGGVPSTYKIRLKAKEGTGREMDASVGSLGYGKDVFVTVMAPIEEYPKDS